jgi:formylglycine-generating enzyme required for sulfatase activity/serine/threonine protein kinase
VVIHDFGEDSDGTAYIVMELLIGRSLRQVLTQEGTIGAIRAYGIIRQASAALDAGHRNGIVHRDIKPDNIILLDSNDAADHVKILDFGIAKVLDNKTMDTHSLEQRLTNVGSVIGTPHYMAPEQCQGEEADARSDIYSLGVVLYELLTGVAPFLAKTPTGVAIKHVTEKPRPLREINPSVPEAVERVVLHALEKDPNARPQTALELSREYEGALTNEQDTLRFTRSGESQLITTSMINRATDAETAQTPAQPVAAVPSQNFETTISPPTGQQGFETTLSPPTGQQGFETTLSPPTGQQGFETTLSPVTGQEGFETNLSFPSGEQGFETNLSFPSGEQGFETNLSFPSGEQGFETTLSPPTDQLKPSGEGATELIASAKFTAQPPKPATETTRPGGQPSGSGDPATELLLRSEDRPQVKPVEPARSPEVGKKPPPADKPEKKEKKEKKKADVPPSVKKPGPLPVAKFKKPLLIGAGAALAPIIAVILWIAWPKTDKPTVIPPTPPPPTPVVIEPPAGMVYVSGGALRVGRDDGDEYEKPAHEVTVGPFFIDITEVINEQYKKFIDATGNPPPPVWQGNNFPEGANTLPVTDVTWQDANAYANWLGDGKRLPTEFEWEFAARGTDGRIYPWGKEWIPNLSNTKVEDNDKRQLVLVRQFPSGVSPFRLHDMSGNAWEWTANDYKEYPGGAAYNPPVGYKNLKVIRGGSYDSLPKFATATVRRPWPATRGDAPPGKSPDYSQTGFRLAKDAPKQQDAPKQ